MTRPFASPRTARCAVSLQPSPCPLLDTSVKIAALLEKSINEGDGNHTSPDGRFELELNDGSMWILYSSDPELEFHYITAQPNEPNK